MKTMLIAVWLLGSLTLAVQAAAPPGQPHQGSAEFERLKALAGTWKGTVDMGQGAVEATLQYRVVAGGSVVEERLFVDTPMEMVTMYHDRQGRLALTHYCLLANQPGMLLKSSDARTLRFDFDKTCGINAGKETHMHSLALTLVDAETLEQRWEHYQGGKATAQSRTFTFKRTKS